MTVHQLRAEGIISEDNEYDYHYEHTVMKCAGAKRGKRIIDTEDGDVYDRSLWNKHIITIDGVQYTPAAYDIGRGEITGTDGTVYRLNDDLIWENSAGCVTDDP